MHRLLRDPLLHFALLGAALFGVFLLTSGETQRDDLIVVSAAQQEQLAAAFERTWRRAPGETERESLIDNWVREEIANREAQAMGLAEGDLIVRRRLRQKYETFMQQFAARAEPGAGALETWHGENRERYRVEARYGLSHRFFSADRRDDPRADAAQALAALNAADPAAGGDIGDSLALPQRFDDTRASELGKRFGDAFSSALAELPRKRWAGPVASAYGYHLVFIDAATPAYDPPLDQVRDEVLQDWRDAEQRATREALYTGLRERYRVKVEPTSVD